MTNTEKTVTWGLGALVVYLLYQYQQSPAQQGGAFGGGASMCAPSVSGDENVVPWVSQLAAQMDSEV